ncbi:MAG TPA: hypothetical protein VF729_04365, partial [Solirubrobacterales bacterium]
MGFAIGRARGRARWLGLFTVLLLISSAVPVLAESTPPGQPEEAPVLSEAEAGEHPTAADVANGIDEAESVEGEEEELRETPQAEREREESKLAYSDVSPAEAAELLREEFSEQLALIDQDPARAL